MLSISAAQAEVKLPNGEYTETHEDLSVKVLGGDVRILRTWTNGRWYVNPTWADLRLIYDSLDNSVKAVDRAGSIYERSGNAYTLENSNRSSFIKTEAGWRWRDYRGNWIDYDAQGHATAYGDARPIKVQFERDAEGRLISVKDTNGNVALTFSYQSERLASVRDRSGREVRYTYVNDRLQEVADTLGNVWTYAYDANGQLLASTDPENRTTILFYALSVPAGDLAMTSGKKKAALKINATISPQTTGKPAREFRIARVGSITDPDGNVTTYNYKYEKSAKKYTVTTTDPEGTVTQGIYDANGKLRERYVAGRLVQTLILDGKNTEVMIDERGLSSRVEYDSLRNPLRAIYQDGSSVSYTYDAYGNQLTRTNELGVVSRYQYDSYNNLIKEIQAADTPVEQTTTYAYEGLSKQTITRKGAGGGADASTVLAYDSYGNIASYTDPEGNKTAYTYDTAGNVLSEISPQGSETRYTYDAAGNLTGVILAYAKPEQQNYTYSYDKAGNIITETDARNKVRQHQYNGENLPVKSTDPLQAVRKMAYDKNSRIKKYTEEDNNSVTYSYDQEGRLSKVLDDKGNAVKLVFAQTQAEYAQGSKPLKIEYPTFAEHFKYDPRNRIVMHTAASGEENLTQRYGYNATGAVIESTDANGFTTFYEYDALGRLTKITDRINASMSVTYDSRGNVTSFQDGKGNATKYTYDRANRLIKIEDPQARATQYTYDKDDRVTQIQPPSGSKIDYTYDALDRLVKAAEYASGEATAYKTTTYTYDAADNLTGWSDGVHASTLTYDDADQLLSERINYGSFSLGYAYTYTPGGLISSMTGPDGVTVSYIYDAQGALVSATIPGQGEIKLEDYQWHKPKKATYPGGVTQELAYDPFLKMTQLKVKKGAQEIGSLANQYDKREQVTQKTVDAQTQGYTYNAEQRMTAAGSENFVLDATGNRVESSKTSGAWVYNNLNQLIQKGGDTYEYDTNGNLAKHTAADSAIRKYKYDAFNRLIEVTDGSNLTLARYGYDPFDFRLWKEVGGEKTYYLYANQGLIAEANSSGQLQVNYGWEPQEYNSTAPLYQKRGSDYAYLHYDDLGSPFKATDSEGRVVWSASYDSFGKATIAETSTATINLRLPGQYYDQETGLHYNERRYYDPVAGRYITQDPLGLYAGQNLYAYVDHDPANLIDPTGEIAPIVGAYARCVLSCAGMACLEGLMSGGCAPCDGAKDCLLECLKPWNWLGPRGAKGKCNSFTGDTLVHTENGAKRIDQIELNEKVLAYSELEEVVRPQQVTDIISSYREQRLIHITLENGGTITATDAHPFSTSEGWRAAALLKAGGQLDLKGEGNDQDRRWVTITQIKQEQKTVPVYNLEVAQDHTYFVGEEGVLVHNGRGRTSGAGSGNGGGRSGAAAGGAGGKFGAPTPGGGWWSCVRRKRSSCWGRYCWRW